MSRRISDTWLWLGLGVTLFVGIKSVAWTVQQLVQSADTDRDYSEHATEASFAVEQKVNEISLESLRVLATCQNANIRKAARRIFLDRLFADEVSVNQFLRDLSDPSVPPNIRHKAENAFVLLESCYYAWPSLRGIMDVIKERRPDLFTRNQTQDTLDWLLPPDESELSQTGQGEQPNILPRVVQSLLDGVTSEEQARPLWGAIHSGTLEREIDQLSPEERAAVHAALEERYQDLLADIGGIPRPMAGRAAIRARPRPRVSDESPEELARRRRRREAMVLNEGDRPLSQNDIIQRRRTEEGAVNGADPMPSPGQRYAGLDINAPLPIIRQIGADENGGEQRRRDPTWRDFISGFLIGWE